MPSSASQVSGERICISSTPAASIMSAARSSIRSLRAEDHLAGLRVEHVLRRDPAQDALGERGHDLAVADRRARGDRAVGAAVVDLDDAVLRHVDQAAGQVARVRGLQRGVGQALAGAVGRVEVLEHGQAFLEVRDDRRLDDLAATAWPSGRACRRAASSAPASRGRRSAPSCRPSSARARGRASSLRTAEISSIIASGDVVGAASTRRRPPCCTSRPG